MKNKTEYIGYRITKGNRYYIGVVKAYKWHLSSKGYKCKTHGDMPATPYYMGSGYAIRKAILKHGADAFEREILARFDNKQDASAWERANVVMQEQDPLSYNIAGGGKRGFKVAKSSREKLVISLTGTKRTDKTKAKISKAQAGEKNPNYGKFGTDNPKYNHDAPRYPSGRIKPIAKVK